MSCLVAVIAGVVSAVLKRLRYLVLVLVSIVFLSPTRVSRALLGVVVGFLR